MKTVKTTQAKIEQCFDDPAPMSYVPRLYEIATGAEWEQIAAIDDWPRVNRKTAEFIMQKAIAHDKAAEIPMPGAAWMNSGFGQDNTLPDWTIKTDMEKITLREGATA